MNPSPLRPGFTVKFCRLLGMIAWTLLAVSTLHATEIPAKVYSVTGTVEFAPPTSASFSPLLKGQELPIGSTIRTGDNGVAVLVTTPGSAIQLGNNSILKINALNFAQSGGNVTERKAVLELTSGVVSALINPKTPKVTDFKIQTPQGSAAARGTFYAVLVYNGKTYVGVKEGRVAASAP